MGREPYPSELADEQWVVQVDMLRPLLGDSEARGVLSMSTD